MDDSHDSGILKTGQDRRDEPALLLKLGDHEASSVLPHTCDLGHRLPDRLSQVCDLIVELSESMLHFGL